MSRTAPPPIDRLSGAAVPAATTSATPTTCATGTTSAAAAQPDWARIKALFERLLEYPPGERAGAAGVLEADAAVVAEALALLAQHEAAQRSDGGFLSPARAAAAWTRPAERTGQRLGQWQLDELLGSGGMADVWAAHRADGAFEGEVAIKLLRPGIDNARVLARFAGEQRALARLSHPHIARLVDAGRAPDGTPYFVMERVRGRPIDVACAGQPLAEQLRLFLQLADAISFAHRHLLVHRDLKPANVLVTAEGQVKLLDFGIAKALDALEGTDPALTQAGERPLTPHYASPEQVRGEVVGIGTDVYSLGVLLYLLLTGQRPYARECADTRAALRAVLEEPARPPSLAVASGAALARALRGDLDRIVLKCLAKAPDERYATVDALVADLRAWQQGRPVSASQPRPGYLLARFVARHRAAVAVAALAMLALLGALAALVQQVHEKTVARAAAERRFAQARALAQRLVFEHHDRIANLSGAVPAREALLADAQRMLAALAADAGTDLALASELAAAHFRIAGLQGETFSPSLERLDAAEVNLERALALQALLLRGNAADVRAALPTMVDMWLARSLLHTRRGRARPALEAVQQARSLAERMRGEIGDTPPVVSRLATLEGRTGLVLAGSPAMAHLGRMNEADEHYRRSTQLFETLVQREPTNPEWQHQLAWAVGNEHAWSFMQGRFADARAQAERSLALRERAAAERPHDGHLRYQAVVSRLRLGNVLAFAGDHAQAQRLLDEVHAATARSAAAEPANHQLARDLAILDVVRARAAALAGRAGEAWTLTERALAALPAAHGDDFLVSQWRAETHLWRARLRLLADPTRALREADAAIALMRATPDDPDNAPRAWTLALAEGERAGALRRLAREAEAQQAAREARRLWGAEVVPLYRPFAQAAGVTAGVPAAPR